MRETPPQGLDDSSAPRRRGVAAGAVTGAVEAAEAAETAQNQSRNRSRKTPTRRLTPEPIKRRRRG